MLNDYVLKWNQKHPESVQKSQKKSASLLQKDIIRDQRAPRKLQRSLNAQASERSAEFLPFSSRWDSSV